MLVNAIVQIIVIVYTSNVISDENYKVTIIVEQKKTKKIVNREGSIDLLQIEVMYLRRNRKSVKSIKKKNNYVREVVRSSARRKSLMCMFIKVYVNSVIVLTHFECLLYDKL